MKWLLPFFLFISLQTLAQDSLNKKRVAVVGGGNAVIGGGSVALLSAVWYSDYPKSDFHLFNDGTNWMQMDKVGHAYTAYQLCRAEHAAWTWTGLSNKRSALLSS